MFYFMFVYLFFFSPKFENNIVSPKSCKSTVLIIRLHICVVSVSQSLSEQEVCGFSLCSFQPQKHANFIWFQSRKSHIVTHYWCWRADVVKQLFISLFKLQINNCAFCFCFFWQIIGLLNVFTPQKTLEEFQDV